MSHPLLSLLQLSDPALPIGGYAHSGGLETYVQAGVVRDVGTAESFVREMLSKNVFYTDAALMALAYGGGDLLELDALCEAVKLPKEVRQSSRKLGGRLLKIFGGIGMVGIPEYDRAVREKRTPGHYSIVFGYCAATLGVGLREALTGYYYNAAAAMITNCVKLIPIGQQDGQALLFGLQSLIGELVEGTLEPDRDLIGFCCAGLDIRCMQHEHLYSRLYMS
jgi:urease accessory protein